jgi:hypothetical protein
MATKQIKSRKTPRTKPSAKPAKITEAEIARKLEAAEVAGAFATPEPTFTLTELAKAYGSNFSIGGEYTPYSFAREVIDDAHRELQVIYDALWAADGEGPLVDAIHNLNCRLELAGNALAKFYRPTAPKAEVAQ